MYKTCEHKGCEKRFHAGGKSSSKRFCSYEHSNAEYKRQRQLRKLAEKRRKFAEDKDRPDKLMAAAMRGRRFENITHKDIIQLGEHFRRG